MLLVFLQHLHVFLFVVKNSLSVICRDVLCPLKNIFEDREREDRNGSCLEMVFDTLI